MCGICHNRGYWGTILNVAIKAAFSKSSLLQCYFTEEEEDDAKPDTLKILQSKFGSPVYDPTSPMQIAYG